MNFGGEMSTFLRWICAALLSVAVVDARAADAVAVLYFDNQGNPDLEPLKVGLSQMLITDLQGDVDVVERARLQAVLDELTLGHGGVVDPDTAARVGRLVGARWLVLGSYFELLGTLRIDARLVNVETGEIRSAHGASGARASFFELERQIAAELRPEVRRATGVEVAPAPPAEPGRERRRDRGGPPEPLAPSDAGTSAGAADPVAAAVAYSEGLIALDRDETARAREAFERAVAADARLEAARAELAAMGP